MNRLLPPVDAPVGDAEERFDPRIVEALHHAGRSFRGEEPLGGGEIGPRLTWSAAWR